MTSETNLHLQLSPVIFSRFAPTASKTTRRLRWQCCVYRIRYRHNAECLHVVIELDWLKLGLNLQCVAGTVSKHVGKSLAFTEHHPCFHDSGDTELERARVEQGADEEGSDMSLARA